jgi:hypothetical protein
MHCTLMQSVEENMRNVSVAQKKKRINICVSVTRAEPISDVLNKVAMRLVTATEGRADQIKSGSQRNQQSATTGIKQT